MEGEKIHQLALELVPHIGDVNAKILISYCGSASKIFESKKSHLQKIPGIGPKTIDSILHKQTLREAEKIQRECERQGIEILHYTDKKYPSRLKQIIDAPNILYKKGNHDLESQRMLGVVGTRNATPYGREVTEKIVKESAPLNASIISGLAYGIDISAHKAALACDIPTLAILAGGLDKIYPAVHKKQAEEILGKGALLSENPPGTVPEAHFFPARNRIIAGLSDGVIVVEAARKGGALITANIADSYNKVIFAVPGDLTHTYSEGCNYLIRNQKAVLYTGIEVLDFHLNWAKDSREPVPNHEATIEGLSQEEKIVFQLLLKEQEGVSIDNLSWKSQIALNHLAGILLNLEFQGLIKSLPGKKYKAS